ncbi:hypothetical protein Taro_012321, partial [Colocasia esculenta]|nr:hypothetical protein [Colocasia esculenta]
MAPGGAVWWACAASGADLVKLAGSTFSSTVRMQAEGDCIFVELFSLFYSSGFVQHSRTGGFGCCWRAAGEEGDPWRLRLSGVWEIDGVQKIYTRSGTWRLGLTFEPIGGGELTDLVRGKGHLGGGVEAARTERLAMAPRGAVWRACAAPGTDLVKLAQWRWPDLVQKLPCATREIGREALWCAEDVRSGLLCTKQLEAMEACRSRSVCVRSYRAKLVRVLAIVRCRGWSLRGREQRRLEAYLRTQGPQ